MSKDLKKHGLAICIAILMMGCGLEMETRKSNPEQNPNYWKTDHSFLQIIL